MLEYLNKKKTYILQQRVYGRVIPEVLKDATAQDILDTLMTAESLLGQVPPSEFVKTFDLHAVDDDYIAAVDDAQLTPRLVNTCII